MKMFSFAILLATMVAVTAGFSGCQSTPSNDDVVKQVEYSCVGASTALKTLKVANDAGKLSEATQKQIIDAAATIAPICGAPEAPSLDSLELAAFNAAVGKLQLAAKASPQ